MRLVIVKENDPEQKERELSLKSFVLGYEPSDELRKDYEHICLARPERGRREDRPGLHPDIQKVLRAVEKAQKAKARARRGYRRP